MAGRCSGGREMAGRHGAGGWRVSTSINLKMFVVHGFHAVGVCVLHDVRSSIDSSLLPFVTSTSYLAVVCLATSASMRSCSTAATSTALAISILNGSDRRRHACLDVEAPCRRNLPAFLLTS